MTWRNVAGQYKGVVGATTDSTSHVPSSLGLFTWRERIQLMRRAWVARGRPVREQRRPIAESSRLARVNGKTLWEWRKPSVDECRMPGCGAGTGAGIASIATRPLITPQTNPMHESWKRESVLCHQFHCFLRGHGKVMRMMCVFVGVYFQIRNGDFLGDHRITDRPSLAWILFREFYMNFTMGWKSPFFNHHLGEVFWNFFQAFWCRSQLAMLFFPFFWGIKASQRNITWGVGLIPICFP